MVKVAISVDNHFDVNHVDGFEMLKYQAAYLVENGYRIYVNAGDTYNDFTKTLDYYRALQRELGDQVIVRFLAGNHDMVKGATYGEIQSDVDPLYLHEKVLSIPSTNAVIIGNNGWYDYSLGQLGKTKTDAAYAQWKRAFWIDSAIDSPLSDAERMQRVLQTSQAAIDANQGRQMIYVTHFVPIRGAMVYAVDRPAWQMATALMGSAKLGELLTGRVDAVAFGHEHFRDAPKLLGKTAYYHQPLGYGLKRLFEWESHDWLTEWRNTLVTLHVPSLAKS
ncbi:MULTISPECIES: metallophosphoesterase [Lacticaseibacillus]|mgnify:CR=1 FL=1|uniref:Phosphohydrolase n=1 Tax=Lacticaseibacillus casei DSM 20011 = JCM 1134 = ATCC 393 TaxID=1423732 RepID=A0AAD1ET14_LACCA|nr:metallophosphoesterase [Lacticaseibacillus casei]MBI6598434.1 metallophosphoesterase [Lacticaseibacillus casei]MBO1482115.1 metallophosphoesterase [Lacticaseibacillus casei]MBO2417367.1 metallophosphoesterase [Lacticaseibacillus casei]MCK2081771.1 metallophosphoesterase [Lacticaseibacillus casei]MDZ5496756.1 metallophosphoesterase [Lacticaseibacillus casei]